MQSSSIMLCGLLSCSLKNHFFLVASLHLIKSAKFKKTQYISLVMDGHQTFISDHICWKWHDWWVHCLQFWLVQLARQLPWMLKTLDQVFRSDPCWYMVIDSKDVHFPVPPTFSTFNPLASWHWPMHVWMGWMSKLQCLQTKGKICLKHVTDFVTALWPWKNSSNQKYWQNYILNFMLNFGSFLTLEWKFEVNLPQRR